MRKREMCKVKVAHLCQTLQPYELYSLWNSLGQNTGVGRLSLLQGIFPTPGSNSGLPHCRWILYQLGHKGNQREAQGKNKGSSVFKCIYICNTKLEKAILLCIMWDKPKADLIDNFCVLPFSAHPYMHTKKALLNQISKSKYGVIYIICSHIPHGHSHLLVSLTTDKLKS